MRDGLVHAHPSRPETSSQPADMPSPHPSREILEQLPAGDATKVVVELIKKLHEAVRTDKPPWLVVYPESRRSLFTELPILKVLSETKGTQKRAIE